MSIAAEVFNRAILNRIYDKVEKKLRPFQARYIWRTVKRFGEDINIIATFPRINNQINKSIN